MMSEPGACCVAQSLWGDATIKQNGWPNHCAKTLLILREK